MVRLLGLSLLFCLDEADFFLPTDVASVVEERLSSNVADLIGGKFPSVALDRGNNNG